MKKTFLLILFIAIVKTGLFAQASESVKSTPPLPNAKSDSTVISTAHVVVTDNITGAVIREYDIPVTRLLLPDQKPYITNDSMLVPKKK
ncbi:MAG TPA: hypothetical protein VE978_19865 [Chitinophagales bacterium]|nr:hypothetical protein [Chitinophagales bacterium]